MTKIVKEDDAKIGQRIRAFRIAAGLSQEKLGESLGLTFQQVQKYEKGTNRVSGSRLIEIAGVLNTKVADICGESISDESPEMLAAMATRQGQSLVRIFNRIEQESDRAMIVALARRLAGESAAEDGA